jgi:hypothetical protein
MTKSEYADYQAAVEAFFEREGLDTLSNGSVDHNYDGECTNEECIHDSNGDFEPQSYFSWSPCDVCRRPLGGDREDCIGYNPTTKKIQGDYRVCTDCIYYNAYGQLDDMTMMEMSDD